MIHQLEKLPYAYDALEPYISKETLEYHHDKHHAGYVNNLNNLIKDSESYRAMQLEEVIKNSENAIFNNAAQTYNHNFYWHCLSPKKSTPSASFQTALEHQFGSLETFKELFTNAALGLFGSGWTWLVMDHNKNLSLTNTSNADTPIVQGDTPLLVCDVWEHAYYIDTRNARAAYLENFWHIVNWQFVSQRFDS